MAEQQTEHEEPAAPDEPGHDGTNDERLSRIETTLAEVIEFLKGGGPPTTAEAEPERDIKAEMREAIREVQAADKAKADKAQAAQSVQDQIGELRAAIERQPREYKKATRRMGWVLESEQ